MVLRNDFIQGCLRDELLRKILAPNTALLSVGHTTTTNVPITTFSETGAAV